MDTELLDLTSATITDLSGELGEAMTAAVRWAVEQCDNSPSLRASGGNPGGGAQRLG
ncbi:hypothetical protein OKJ48_00920 [Streptomyces kunmingensis]|uniref:Uncharacterized protein n=1 Tax=Streptomyces kunmingensis TaxID=68225 RepID=A0ABU6C2A2_9ACTN|nr:hypothetical protein [Streptomyces kunmingensis]MEB3958826.1 hypothetical protein [Streptomyces kunmingensis]